MKNDAIIFDIDGTLWDACPALAKGWEKALRSVGEDISVSREDIASVAGKPFDECIEILFPGMMQKHDGLWELISEGKKEFVLEEGGAFYQGVLDGIPQLAQTQDVYIISNCQDWYMEVFLDMAGFREQIISYDCNGMSGEPKDVMLKNMQRAHNLENPLYVGDTGGDEAATSAAGVEFLYAAYGFGTVVGEPKSANSFLEVLEYLQS